MSTHLIEQLQRAAHVKAFESPEAALVAKVNRLKTETNTRSWELADSYAELSRIGWSQERIAELAGVSQQTVSRFLACVKDYALGCKRPTFWEAYKEIRSDKQKEPPVSEAVAEAPFVQTDPETVVGPDGTEYKAPKPSRNGSNHKKARSAPGDDFEAPGEPGSSPYAKFADRMEKCVNNKLDEMLQTLILKPKDIEVLKGKFKFDFSVLRGHAAAEEQPAPDPVRKPCQYCGRDIVLARTAKNAWMTVQESNKGRFDIIENRIVSVDSGPYRAHFPMCSGSIKK